MLNIKVVSSGKLPTKWTVEHWIEKAASNK